VFAVDIVAGMSLVRCDDFAALYAALACATAVSIVSRTAVVAWSRLRFTADVSRSACVLTSEATFRLCFLKYSRDSRPLAGAIISAAAAPSAVPATNKMSEPFHDDVSGS
jgi:hypothetical protein